MSLKELIFIDIIIYLGIAVAFFITFKTRFNLRCTIKVKDECYQKDLSGILLVIICLFWIISIPHALKGTENMNKEE